MIVVYSSEYSRADDEASKVRQGRIRDGIAKNRYATEPGKLAAWILASHIEKGPKKTAPTP